MDTHFSPVAIVFLLVDDGFMRAVQEAFPKLDGIKRISTSFARYSPQIQTNRAVFQSAGKGVPVEDQPRSVRQADNLLAAPKARCRFLNEAMRLCHRLVLV